MSQSAPSHRVPVNPGWYATAIQAMVVLCRSGEVCPSGMLAEHVGAHAVFVRRILAQLVRAGLVTAREGRIGGYQLVRPPEQIRLGDIYRALQTAPTDAPEIAERGPTLEQAVRHTLADIYHQTEDFLLMTLDEHSLAEITAPANDGANAAPRLPCESVLDKDGE